MPRMMLLLLVIVATVTTTVACSRVFTTPLRIQETQSATPENRFEALDRWLQSLYDSKRFHGTVLIGDSERVLFSNSYGFEDPESTSALKQSSVFNLASVSKQFTAMAVLLLEHEGKLSVSDLLRDHVPEMGIYPDITIEHLLHHTSGIADYMRLAIKHNADKELFKTSDLISLFTNQQPPLDFRPGTKFQYSNTGYVLLAEIVARASGKTFDAYLSENVIKPAGMTDSQVFNRLSTSEPADRVFGFKRSWLNRAKTRPHDLNNFDGVAGDGGVYASARDLHRWHQALLTGKLLPHSVYRRATTSGTLEDGSETGYGYGWFVQSETVVDHAGGWVGFSAYIYRDLATGKLLVILDNSSNALRVVPKGFRFTSIGLNLIDFVEDLPARFPAP